MASIHSAARSKSATASSAWVVQQKICPVAMGPSWPEDAQASVLQFRQAGATVADSRPSENSGSRLSNVTAPDSIRIEINEQPTGSLMRKAMEAWK